MNSRGGLVISLDFELAWGVREKLVNGGTYLPAIIGAREAIPRMLRLFERYGIAATWATVGMLFAKNGEELRELKPEIEPHYSNPSLNPYQDLIEGNERSCPSHFASSLIDRICETPKQELATHTYSHFYCCEQGATAEAFAADLDVALELAGRRGLSVDSIIFPRNQHNKEFSQILSAKGIFCYRGTEIAWFHRPVTSEKTPVFHRLGRGFDYYVNLSGSNTVGWDEVAGQDGLCNIRSSRFLRSYSKSRAQMEWVRRRRIVSGLREAAATGRIFHLWWHPHNFGLDTDENLAFLEGILKEVVVLREIKGLECLTMSEIGKRCRDGEKNTTPNGVQ